MRRMPGYMLALLGAACSAFGGEITGYEGLASWLELPRARTAAVAGMASSYDREGRNQDFNHYQWPEGLQEGDVDTVVTSLTGPGVITRFWMPHACSNEAFPIRITVDGGLRIDTNSDDLLGGSYGYVTDPMTQTLIGGQVSYEPIAFQTSLVIESANYSAGPWARRHHYYQYSYYLFEPGRTVAPYTGTLSQAQQADRTAAVNVLSNVGANPAGADPAAVTLSEPARSIPGGSSLVLAEVSGAGKIRRLHLKMAGAADADPDGLRLRITYDDRPEHAVDVPVAHFFGAGHGRADYDSLPLGADSEEGFYCYWPMPFRRRMKVELHNATASAIPIDSAAVEYQRGGVSEKDGYLHARFAEQVRTGGDEHHRLLLAEGSGHYVGNLLYLQRDGTSLGILEGDDIITVDGQHVLYGTGLEDAYNGGYYYNHVLPQDDDGDVPYAASGDAPFHGLLRMDCKDLGDDSVRTDQYRWLITDAVPFTESIEVLNESIWNGTDALFGSTAFYYLMPPAPIPGDANFDNEVGIADLAALADHYGLDGMEWMQGDFNDDGVVGIADLAALADHYGQVEALRPALPEPCAALLLMAGVPCLLRGSRRPGRPYERFSRYH